MNASVVDVMHVAGKAINDTFHLNDVGKATAVTGSCGPGVSVLDVSGPFDYIVTMEDLVHGQRIGNYSIEYRAKGSVSWEVLVPPVRASHSPPPPAAGAARVPTAPAADGPVSDRPDGHDPRDQYIGHRRIDIPIVSTEHIAQVRFNCLRLIKAVPTGESVHLRQFSVHKKIVPWE